MRIRTCSACPGTNGQHAALCPRASDPIDSLSPAAIESDLAKLTSPRHVKARQRLCGKAIVFSKEGDTDALDALMSAAREYTAACEELLQYTCPVCGEHEVHEHTGSNGEW